MEVEPFSGFLLFEWMRGEDFFVLVYRKENVFQGRVETEKREKR